MSGSRERFFKTVRHERPDRVPLDLWARPEVYRSLREYLHTPDVETALGIDFARVAIPEYIPAFAQKAEKPRGGDWPGADGSYIWHDDRTFENAWGVIHRVGQDGKLIEWVRGPLVDTPDVDSYSFPVPSFAVGAPELALSVQRLKDADRVVLAEVVMPFKRAWQMRGMENLLCDMLVNREFVEQLYDRIYEFETARAVRGAEAGVDCLTVIGDIAMADRLLFNPALFRELDIPRMRALIQKARRVKPDILMFYHSDGDISAVMDDLIGVGFDIINPIQPECMDPDEVKQRWGRAITMWGTISIRTTLPRGTPESVRTEVRERIRRCGHDGGLVICPSNDIMYDTPVENIIAMYEAAAEYAWDE